MVNVSKRALAKSQRDALLSEWVDVFSYTGTKAQMQQLTNELVTSAERLQFGKRLAIIAMIDRGVAFSDIERVLHVSSATVAKYGRAYNRGAYRNLRRILTHRRFDATIAGMLEKLLGPSLELMGKKRRPVRRV